MANVAIVDLDRFPPGNRLPIGNRKIFNALEPGVPLAFFFNGAVGPFDIEKPVTLNANGPGARCVGGNGVGEFVTVHAIAQGLRFSRILSDRGFVVQRRPGDYEREVIHL